MKDTRDLLDFEIYPHVDRAEAVRNLLQDKGKYYLCLVEQSFDSAMSMAKRENAVGYLPKSMQAAMRRRLHSE